MMTPIQVTNDGVHAKNNKDTKTDSRTESTMILMIKGEKRVIKD